MSVKNKINDMEGAYENNKEIKKNGCRSIGFAYGNVWDSKHLGSRYGRKCTFINGILGRSVGD